MARTTCPSTGRGCGVVADALSRATVVKAEPGHYQWTWPPADELDVALQPVAVLFVDRSKNHSRRWCDMNDCGKAQKMERYVARRAAAKRRTA